VDFHFGDGLWGWWLLGVALIALFWGLVIAALVLGIRWLVRADRRGRYDSGDPALDELRARYARGEIDEEEFERRRRFLTTTRGGGT